MVRFWKAVALLGTLLALSLPGCSSPDSTSSEATPADYAGQVMLYSSMQEDQLLAVKEGFEQKYPNVTMEYYFASTAKVLTKIATESQSGRLLADLIWVGDPSDYVALKNSGVLQPYISPQGIHIDPIYLDSDHYFTGARLLNVGIAYNTDLITEAEAPKTWNDLLDPKWKDQIVMTDPGSAGTIKYFVGALMGDDRYGEQYFTRLRENGCELESGSAATHRQVATGSYALGICLDYMTENLAGSGEPLAFVYPRQDSVGIYSPIGLAAQCANEQNGKLLYDFILSKEGQEILVNNNLTSIREDVEQRGVGLAAITESGLSVDLEWIAAHSEQVMRRFDEIFG